jgi:hypothetical protein
VNIARFSAAASVTVPSHDTDTTDQQYEPGSSAVTVDNDAKATNTGTSSESPAASTTTGMPESSVSIDATTGSRSSGGFRCPCSSDADTGRLSEAHPDGSSDSVSTICAPAAHTLHGTLPDFHRAPSGATDAMYAPVEPGEVSMTVDEPPGSRRVVLVTDGGTRTYVPGRWRQ